MRNSTSPALAPTSDVDSRRDGSGTFLSILTHTHTPAREALTQDIIHDMYSSTCAAQLPY
ncbi:hypothetical protein B9Z19DRAFT_1092384 [Tuber borchii]|uniref:Uncharacterized protein n=1 Tax=Tuber borchii TaxID=42251 RepID=A0A2T6ZGM3_TUBBO|nr:hypothetical protein B9Z19DRAFT_1092384 [Tuber borchii]